MKTYFNNNKRNIKNNKESLMKIQKTSKKKNKNKNKNKKIKNIEKWQKIILKTKKKEVF